MRFLRKKSVAPAVQSTQTCRSIPSFWGKAREADAAPAPDCAIWNDIARALDTKPRSVEK